MNRRRVEQCAFGCVLLVVVGVTAFFTWPNYARAHQFAEEAAVLDAKIGHLVDAESEVEQRRTDLARLRAERDQICLGVPDHPDVANLMKHLSIGINGDTVIDQTFTVRGTPDSAGNDRFEILPLVVEMDTTFEHAFNMIRRVEKLNRLVRVTSVQMEGSRKSFESGSGTIQASVGLDVVYERSDSKGAR
ncbi:MAG: type 4a pilus biogenesis protein PilO [Planctomycetota bacterium]|nr:type 4a pilus biogenesis protein PilO [Planctomycetota bacterium]